MPGTTFPITTWAGMPNTTVIIPVAVRIFENPSKKIPMDASMSPFPHQRYLNCVFPFIVNYSPLICLCLKQTWQKNNFANHYIIYMYQFLPDPGIFQKFI